MSLPCVINKNNTWFTPQLKQLRKEVGAAYHRQKENNTAENKDICKDRLKWYKKLIRKTKNEYNAKYVDSIKNEEEMSHFVKGFIKQKNSRKTINTKKGLWLLYKNCGRGPIRIGLHSLLISQTHPFW